MKKVISLFIIFFALVELISMFKLIDRLFFPSTIDIFNNLFTLISSGELIRHSFYSSSRLLFSFLLAFPTSIFIALICVHVKIIDNFFNSLIALTFPLPKVSIFPLLLLIFGIDDKSKTALITTGIFYLMFINFRIGFLRLTNSNYREVVRIYPLTKWNYFYNFLIKGSLQEIHTGLQVAINYGLTLIVVSEISVSNNGIGYFIWKSWDQFNILNVYSATLYLGFIGYIIYHFFNYLIEKNNKLQL